jgi:hypothetical protein
MQPRPGKPLGKCAVIPQTLGWVGALSFFILVSMLVAAGTPLDWIALILFWLIFGALLRYALKFAFYRRNLAGAKNKLIALLSSFGTASGDSAKQAQQILRQALSPAAQIQTEVAACPSAQQELVLNFVEEEIRPLLKAPVRGRETLLTARSRWASEFGRSFVLASFILLWFFVVPVPGLLVFTAGAYRFSLGLGTVLLLVIGIIAFVLVAFWTGKLIQWIDRVGIGGCGLRPRAQKAYLALRSALAQPEKLVSPEVASTFALFTDFQTYMDQRSYAYARRSLGLIERNLGLIAKHSRTII